MKKVKIRTTLLHRANQTVTNPACQIKFDENCFAEVDENLVEKIKSFDASILEEGEKTPLPPKKEKTEEDLKAESELSEEEKEAIKLKEEQQLAITLGRKKMPELQEMVSELPKSEWEKLTKPELIKYILAH